MEIIFEYKGKITMNNSRGEGISDPNDAHVAEVKAHTGDLKDMAIIVWTDGQPPVGTKLFLHPAPAPIPEGYALVPLEPTEEMIAGFWGEITKGDPEIQASKDAYKVMLDAAAKTNPGS